MLSLRDEHVGLPLIHSTVKLFEETGPESITDIIPAYEGIALFYDHLLADVEEEVRRLGKLKSNHSKWENSGAIHRVPVCYDMGLDWVDVISHSGLMKQEIIEYHTEATYTLAMMGFLPGFLYLEGLLPLLACPRKANPRNSIPAGSVGIGGDQTGIYSLESPGGWQIIGRTPLSFFDPVLDPPSRLELGTKVQFYAITENEYLNWENNGSE